MPSLTEENKFYKSPAEITPANYINANFVRVLTNLKQNEYFLKERL